MIPIDKLPYRVRGSVLKPLLMGEKDVERVKTLVNIYEDYLSLPRESFPVEFACALFGDEKLASGVMYVIERYFYRYEAKSWQELFTEEEKRNLERKGVKDETSLKLYIYKRVGEIGGFVKPSEKGKFLSLISRELGVPPDKIKEVFESSLTSRRRLKRVGQRPSALDVIKTYNKEYIDTLIRRAVNALLVLRAPLNVATKMYLAVKRSMLTCIARAKGVDLYEISINGPLEVYGSVARGSSINNLLRALIQVSNDYTLNLKVKARLKGRDYFVFLTSQDIALSSLPAENWSREPSKLAERVYSFLRGRGESYKTSMEEPVVFKNGFLYVPDVLVRLESGYSVFIEVVSEWKRELNIHVEKLVKMVKRASPRVNFIFLVKEQFKGVFDVKDVETIYFKGKNLPYGSLLAKLI